MRSTLVAVPPHGAHKIESAALATVSQRALKGSPLKRGHHSRGHHSRGVTTQEGSPLKGVHHSRGITTQGVTTQGVTTQEGSPLKGSTLCKPFFVLEGRLCPWPVSLVSVPGQALAGASKWEGVYG
eukprot:357575-Chlamydomonas_euryale.AAC.3